MSEVKYAEDRPKDCRYCYFWSGKKKGCDLGGEENLLLQDTSRRDTIQ